jgi:hypothetical protein
VPRFQELLDDSFSYLIIMFGESGAGDPGSFINSLILILISTHGITPRLSLGIIYPACYAPSSHTSGCPSQAACVRHRIASMSSSADILHDVGAPRHPL